MITNTNHVGSPQTHALDPRRERASSAAASTPREDSLNTTHANDLKAALARTETLRPEVVERASHLAVDAKYPPLQIIEQVASLLAASHDPSEEQD
jgi:hypothetical protein